MIILRLRGGLGNQLFQYAAGLALADHHKVPLKIDDYTYQINKFRNIELNKFKVDLNIADRKEVHKFTGFWPPSRIFHKLTNYKFNKKVFAQPYYHFYPDFFQLPPNIYLSGYWQSLKYFEHLASLIKTIYQPVSQLDRNNSLLIEKMQKTNAVSVHVRHGDFLSNSKHTSFFGVLAQDYYLKSIDFLNERLDGLSFYVFSDDTKWCHENLGSIKNLTVVEHNRGDQSYLDLYLMTRCNHHIVANSSFSWWGAWLGANPDKIVMAPKRWFRDPVYKGDHPVYKSRYYDEKDLIPGSWIRL